MLSIPNKLLKYLRAASSKLVAIVSFVTEVLGDEQSTLADWQAGGLGGVPGVDYPATALTAPVATADVVINVASTAGFTVGDTGENVGYLVLWDGTFQEIVSYTGSANTWFSGLTRGLFGTSPRAYAPADFVLQLLPGLGSAPDYNLTVNKKNYLQTTAAGGPPLARVGARMVFVPSTGLYYLFGGYDPFGPAFLNDLWTFNPSTDTWALLAPAGGPPATRVEHVMVYNPGYHQIWVTGGRNGGGDHTDTWKYDIAANTWATNVAWDHPGLGKSGAMGCYVPTTAVGGATHVMFVIGGKIGIGYRTEVYLFDGAIWWPFTSIPVGLAYGSATYIDFTGQILLIGVQQNYFTQITYLGNPTIYPSYWNTLPVSPLPALRIYHTAVYDDINYRVLVFGGEDNVTTAYNNLYSYNPLLGVGGTWTQESSYDRENRARHVAAFDTSSKEMVIWGGTLAWGIPTMPVYIHPIRYRAYWVSAKYYTDTIDIGELPEDVGEWLLEDITDTTYGHTSIEYQGEWSLTGVGGWNNIGVIKDGDEITILSRYWRVYVDMANDGFDLAARVTLIDANYNKQIHFSMASEPVGDYPPLVKRVSTLSSKVDVQKCKASIGEIQIELIRSGILSDQVLMTAFPKRKDVRVKLGVIEDDIGLPDFHTVLRARTDDWSVSRTQIVFTLADYIDELKQDIPQEDLSGIVVPLDYQVGGIASNPIDIILDILQNQINLPDRDLDLDSFRVVRDDPSLSGWQFRREFCCPEDASKILEDLCRHIGAALIPRESGKISLIIFNPDNDAVAIWDELNQAFSREKFMGKASSIRNYISTWWDHDGDGEDVSDWGGIEIATDATSITRHGDKLLRTKSKWLGRALPPPSPPYAGDIIALAISDRILDMSKVGLQEVSLSTNMSAFEAQIGDLISVQTNVIRDNAAYKVWQRDNEGERDKRVVKMLESCEDVTTWTRLWAAGNEALNTGVYCYGDGGLDLRKDNTGGVLQQSGYTSTVVYDLSNYDYVTMEFFITDPTILRAAIAVHVEFQTAVGNFYAKEYDVADLVSGFNILGGHKDSFAITGAPDWSNITRLRLYFWTPAAVDLIPLGDIKMDHWIAYRWQRTASNTGRYSLPYINYGTNECVDLKWWIKSKSVDFAKGTINWGLVRARKIPLDAEYTTQADWQHGQGFNIDFSTTPGSILIAIEAGPNYYQSAYGELFIDLGQQPEQDGTYTIEDTIPIGTAIIYEMWSSETGAWAGEENYLGFIVDSDTVEIKSRYYKGRGTLFSDTAKLLTPSIDRFLLRFDLG